MENFHSSNFVILIFISYSWPMECVECVHGAKSAKRGMTYVKSNK